ncbi:MAG: hypothetical protein KBD21_03205 [Candidatus Pacebacteria bacterium]|nr:hypothetical protein [Candidatus Paceibacterota bacterium]
MKIVFGKRVLQGYLQPLLGGIFIERVVSKRLWVQVVRLLDFGIPFSIVAALTESGINWIPAMELTEDEFAVMSKNLTSQQVHTLRAFMESECGLPSSE